MDFREVEGERKGSKVLITEDKHLYRYSKPNTPYIICYLGLVTKIMQKISPNVEQCHATGVVKDGQIVVHKEHNHIPDTRISERLIARKTARDGVTVGAKCIVHVSGINVVLTHLPQKTVALLTSLCGLHNTRTKISPNTTRV